MASLTSSQRKYLRGLAQQRDPVITVGKHGVTGQVIAATNHALDDHELIKIRFNEFKDEKKALTQEIAERTGAEVAGMIGHVAILFRRQADPEKRSIELP